MNVLFLVERHIRRTGIRQTRFGLDAVGDRNFVRQLRRGRELRPATRDRVLAFIRGREGPGGDGAG